MRVWLRYVAIGTWVFGCGLGFFALSIHANESGMPASPPPAVAGSEASARVLVFLHPKCPCSPATVHELARLEPRIGEKASIEVYFSGIDGWEGEVRESGLWRSAKRLKYATVRIDPGGKLARAMGAVTSGQVLLYAPGGELAFSGGITPERGHEGPSAGSALLVDRLVNAGLPKAHSPVFGCALFNPSGVGTP